MTTTAIIEIGKDSTYDIYTNDNRLGFMLLGQGKTIEEAKADFLHNRDELVELYKKRGERFDFDHLEFEYKYDTKSFLKYSPFTLTWLSSATGINKKQLSHYSTGVRNPSKATMEKIRSAIENFVRDYRQVVFD